MDLNLLLKQWLIDINNMTSQISFFFTFKTFQTKFPLYNILADIGTLVFFIVNSDREIIIKLTFTVYVHVYEYAQVPGY